MGKILRRKDKQIPDSEAKEILYCGEYGFLATVSSEGQPYGVPLSYCFIDDAIYFHCAVEGHKLENINHNNNVSFCVVGKTEIVPNDFSTRYESVIVFGKAYELTGEEKLKGLINVANKYYPGLEEKAKKYAAADEHRTRVYKIQVNSITGKAQK